MKIAFCKKLPNWIRSSTVAAYCPHDNTIYLTHIKYFPHELIHWFACKFNIPQLHSLIDGKAIGGKPV
jgi:hypothetical protein